MYVQCTNAFCVCVCGSAGKRKAVNLVKILHTSKLAHLMHRYLTSYKNYQIAYDQGIGMDTQSTSEVVACLSV